MTARSSHRQSSDSLTLPENCQNTVRVSSIPCHVSQVISEASSCHIRSVIMSSPKRHHVISEASSCHLQSVIMSSPKRHHVISKASSCHLRSVIMSSPRHSRSIARPSSSLVAVSQLLFHYVGSVITPSHHYRHLPPNRLQALFQIAPEMSCVPSSRSEGQ